ncbi:hypothetical protein [Spirillospora sp. CA-294931]|uniref:hypothetical protein n=1 Tax=Spirillospora sp. CA-294931 TaxID=3240042 RepID=UPI003D8DD41F
MAPRREEKRGARGLLAGVIVGAALVAVGGVGFVVVSGGDDEAASPSVPKGAAPQASSTPSAPAKLGVLTDVDPSQARDQELNAVAVAGQTVVAAGGEADPAGYRTQFLVSNDAGRTWKAAAVDKAAGARPKTVVGSAGAWLALGDAGGKPAAWSSRDGVRWKAAGAEAFTAQDRVSAVAASPGGLVAVGTEGKDPVLWTSPDGTRWERKNAEQLKLPGSSGSLQLTQLVLDGNEISLHGTRVKHPDRRSPNKRPVGWRSVDGGRTWSKADAPPRAAAAPRPPKVKWPKGKRLGGAAALGDGQSVLVGTSMDGQDADALLVLRDAEGRETVIDLAQVPAS